MSRELWLLRHAKSAWDAPAASDFDRPLAPRGAKDAPKMGRWLHAEGLRPQHIVSSPALRARQTIEAVAEALGLPAAKIHFDERIYMASRDTLLQVLGDCPSKAKQVLLVGHNPGLDALLEYLCGRDLPYQADGKLMTTAALARIRLKNDWQQLDSGVGTLLQLKRPKSL